MPVTVDDIRSFWENNPLFSGESQFVSGSPDFFKEHTKVYIEDVFAGAIPDNLMFPKLSSNMNVLDLGCGIGFWCQELLARYPEINLYATDLTQNAIDLCKKRMSLLNLKAMYFCQNAELMNFQDSHFDHINCQGVIHHTPDTDAAIKEIYRVLKPGCTAYISVYYRNFFLRNWNLLSSIGQLLAKCGAGLKGRGRENIFKEKDVNEITRLYDGALNPLGKSYSRREIINMVTPYFHVEKVFLNFFPARSLPFPLPSFLHLFLSRHFGFMIHLNLRKR